MNRAVSARGWIWLAGLGAALLLLGPPAGSAAAQPISEHDVIVRLVLGARHGYRISVEGSDGVVELRASSPTDEEVGYRVPGLITRHRLKANFGRLGFVSVRFGGGPAVTQVSGSGCGAETETRERGDFTGTIRFRGEHGYTAVAASSARGSVLRYSFGVCLGRARRGALRARRAKGPDGIEKLRTTLLGAGRREGAGGTGFSIESSASPERPADAGVAFVDVATKRRRGRIEIERSGIFEVPARSLSLAHREGATVGSVNLPAPFEGEATFAGSPDEEPVAWTGDLRVALPGDPQVTLAGSGFRSLLCRGRVGGDRYESCATEAVELSELPLVPEP